MRRLYPALFLLTGMIAAEVQADYLQITQYTTSEQLAELRELFSPAPLIKHSEYGHYYFMRVVEKRAVQGPFSFELRAVAYGPKGVPLTGPFTIGPQHGTRVWTHPDSDLDLEILFSDRHARAGLEFGGPQHRTLLFRVLDPDGSMGIGDGVSPPVFENVNEGRLVSATRDGVLDMQDVIRQGIMPSLWRGAPVIVDIKGPASMGAHSLLEWSARASAYPGLFEPGFDVRARRGFGMLCALAKVDVSRVPDAHRAAALQLQFAGLEALDSLWNLLRIEMPYETAVRYARWRGEDLPREFEAVEDQALPLSVHQRFNTIAKLIVEEGSLLHFIPNKYGHLHLRGGFSAPPPLPIEEEDPEFGIVHDALSTTIAKAMVQAAVDNTYREYRGNDDESFEWRYEADPENRALFLTALVKMAGGADAPGELALDQRRYRRVLSEYLNFWQLGETPERSRFVTEVFDQAGWGEPREIMPIVDDTFDRAMDELPYGWQPGVDLSPNATEGFTLLRAMVNARPGRTANAIKSRLEGKILELRRAAAEMARNGSEGPNYATTRLAAWAAFVER